MDAREIAGLEATLVDFLAEFDDCFGRSEPRDRLQTYVSGQLSDLKRKSLDPVLRWMASNVAVEMDAAGNLKPSKKKSVERIDGIVAGIMGLGRMLVMPE